MSRNRVTESTISDEGRLLQWGKLIEGVGLGLVCQHSTEPQSTFIEKPTLSFDETAFPSHEFGFKFRGSDCMCNWIWHLAVAHECVRHRLAFGSPEVETMTWSENLDRPRIFAVSVNQHQFDRSLDIRLRSEHVCHRLAQWVCGVSLSTSRKLGDILDTDPSKDVCFCFSLVVIS